MENSFNFIFIFFGLVVNIMSILGIFYLTKFSFRSSNVENKRCILLTDTEVKLTRFAIILFWFSFFINLFSNMYVYFDKIKIDF